MKTILSISAAITAAVTTAAHAGHHIKVNENKVDQQMITSAKDYINSIADKSISDNFGELITAIDLDSAIVPMDVRLLLASTADSTQLAPGARWDLGACYSNCYDNCHGSRGWR